MEKFFVFLVLCVVVKAFKPNPKFPKLSKECSLQVACSRQHEFLRNNIMEESKCGKPRDFYLPLKPRDAYEQVSPGAVWVKRCQGLCDYGVEGSKCVATKTVIRHIQIRIYSEEIRKEYCTTYPVEEHVSCGCCELSPEECVAPTVFNPQEPEHEVE